MGIKQIRSMVDLINFYGEKDKNKNGRLEAGEITVQEIKDNDKNSDNLLSPWEVMEAVNRYSPIRVFTSDQIQNTRILNEKGRAFEEYMTPEKSIKIQGMYFRAGELISFSENGQVSYGTLAADTTIAGIIFKAGTNIHLYDGKPQKADLVADTFIDGISYKANTVIAFLGGRVYHGTLATDTIIKGTKYKGESHISFDPDGKVSSGTLAEDTFIRGMTFGAGTWVSYSVRFSVVLGKEMFIQGTNFGAGTSVYFIDNRIEFVVLKGNTNIQGINYQAGQHVTFYRSGRVESGTLAGDFIMHGINYKAGYSIYFNEQGKVRQATLASDTILKGTKYKAGYEVIFYGNGRVASGALDLDTYFLGIKFKAEAIIGFYENGKLNYGRLAEDTVITQGIKFKAGTIVGFRLNGQLGSVSLTPPIFWQDGTEIKFYSNGKIRYLILLQNTQIQEYEFKAKTKAEFYPDGRIKSGILAKPTNIQGNDFNEGEWVGFRGNGKIIPKATVESGLDQEGMPKLKTYAYNNGKVVRKKDGTYIFSANHANDPGFGIQMGNYNLGGRNRLTFEIKGNLIKHGEWSRLTLQIFSETDDDYHPSIKVDPLEVHNEKFTKAQVSLGDNINKVRKIQFMLISDKGNCKIEIRNIRFE